MIKEWGEGRRKVKGKFNNDANHKGKRHEHNCTMLLMTHLSYIPKDNTHK